MTALLSEAFEKAAKLPTAAQDAVARRLIDELEHDARWADLFASPESAELLDGWADRVLADHRAGRTRPLDPADL